MLGNGLILDLQCVWCMSKANQHKHAERNSRKQRNTKGLNPVFFSPTVIITELAIMLILYGWHVEES